MIEGEVEDVDAMPIEFRCTKFQYCFTPGSQDSIDFHQSLEETSAETIFQSEVIQQILKYKWSLVKKYAYIQCSILALFLIAMFYHQVFAVHD